MIKNNIKLSPEFRTQTTKAIVSIVFFTLVYILLLLFAVSLTALCVYGGIMLVISFPRLFTIALGIGLASFGFIILFFLLKFIFKSHKVDRSHLYEIKAEDEPELFALIHHIVEEVGTNFPKKVYLSSDINAAVFYDSNFWSMFLPIKKNLQIGLGLVNTITKDELTAILAHEFGHFSQRTMKVGSYVYNVNKVIFNMLYENESYDKVIQNWANASGYFSIFVVLAVKIIDAIKWVLNKMYNYVNKIYMALSREMEFHADEIAANVTGYEPLKNALLRMNLSEYSFNSVLNYYESKISENLKSKNIFKEQEFVLHFLAKNDNLQLEYGFPKVPLEELNKFNKSKLVVKDQWASHPSIEERIERLEEININSKKAKQDPANSTFKNPENIQKIISNAIFKEVKYTGEVILNSFENFKKTFEEEYSANLFSHIYNGYYDIKNPSKFEINTSKLEQSNIDLSNLFSDKIVDLIYVSIALQNDTETLKQIANKVYKVKTFDYEGKKYRQKESRKLLTRLNLELKEVNNKITDNDIKIYKFFKARENLLNKKPLLEKLYQEFFNFDREYDNNFDTYLTLSNQLEFLNYNTPFDKIRTNFLNIEPLEAKLKRAIKDMLVDQKYNTEITEESRKNFELYISKKWTYFGNEKYFEKNLELLFTVMNNFYDILSKGYFILKKKLLDYQTELVK